MLPCLAKKCKQSRTHFKAEGKILFCNEEQDQSIKEILSALFALTVCARLCKFRKCMNKNGSLKTLHYDNILAK